MSKRWRGATDLARWGAAVTPVEAKAAYEAHMVLEGCALVCAVGTGLYVRVVRWALGTVGVWLLSRRHGMSRRTTLTYDDGMTLWQTRDAYRVQMVLLTVSLPPPLNPREASSHIASRARPTQASAIPPTPPPHKSVYVPQFLFALFAIWALCARDLVAGGGLWAGDRSPSGGYGGCCVQGCRVAVGWGWRQLKALCGVRAVERVFHEQ